MKCFLPKPHRIGGQKETSAIDPSYRVNRRRIGLGVGHKIPYLVLGETNLGPNNHTGNELRHGGDDRAFAQTGELCESTAPSAQIRPVVWWIKNI